MCVAAEHEGNIKKIRHQNGRNQEWPWSAGVDDIGSKGIQRPKGLRCPVVGEANVGINGQRSAVGVPNGNGRLVRNSVVAL